MANERMRTSKPSAIIAVVLILAGCQSTENYEKILDTWVGSHVDSLVLSWGPPQGSFKLSNGKTVLEYGDARTVQMGGYTVTTPKTTYQSGTVYGPGGYGTYSGTSTTYVTEQTPTYNLNLWCKTRFIAGSNGIIETWSWEGNDCVASAPD